MSKPAILALAVIALLSSPLPGQNNRESIERGKRSTAFLESPDRKSSASAVCIHPTGVFITNRHVVKNLAKDAKVTLVLNPNEENHRKIQAKVIRQDDVCDLVVLRVETEEQTDAHKAEKKDYDFLALGDDSKLFETMTVTSFGFPFGKSLVVKDQQYPDISVNVGRITALRKRDGKLHQVQLDAQLNPGNSGGPVIDESGSVVGVVNAGVFATGVNFAIPVSAVRSLLGRPELVFDPPAISASQKAIETEFNVELIPFLKPLKETVVELELQVAGKDVRKYTGVARGGNKFVITAVPIPVAADSDRTWVAGTVEFPKGSVRGNLLDKSVEVGGESLKLSDIRSIQGGDQPVVKKHDGGELRGKLTGVDQVQLDLGDYLLQVDLERARQVDLRPVDMNDPTVNYKLIVREKNEELIRREGTLALANVRPATGTASTRFQNYEGAKQVIELPDTIADAVWGAGGRMLLLHLKKTRKVAVYDVNQGKIVRYLPLSSDSAIIAAGVDKLVVVAAAERVIERWSLTTFEKETTLPLPVKGVVKSATLGYASHGPLLLHWAAATDALSSAPMSFFDLKAFEEIKFQTNSNHHSYRDAIHVRASGTGDVFGMWATSHSPQGMDIMAIQGKTVLTKHIHDSAGHIVPNFNGSAIMTGIAGVCSPELNQRPNRNGEVNLPTIPSTHPRFYVAVPTEPGAQRNLGSAPFAGRKPAVHTLGKDIALTELPDLDLGANSENASWGASDFTIDKRVLFVPQANQIVSLPFTNDRVVVQKFDLRETLDKANIDYFYVTSVPGLIFKKGELYRYQFDMAVRRGTQEFEISSGPEGMKIGKDGLLEWNVPGDYKDDKVSVIVTVKNSDGQSLYDSFTLKSE